MKQLGLQSYRFSISWVRVYPNGADFNEKGLKFYHNLINELLKNEIEPVVCLNHFELPIPLYSKGWQHIDTLNAFKKFGITCFEHFGDQVKHWATFNEPWMDQFFIPYEVQRFSSPNLTKKQSKRTIAKALDNLHGLFRAHAETVNAFHTLISDGQIGIILNLNPAYPATADPTDEAAAQFYDAFLNDWQLDLIFKGEYPAQFFTQFQEIFGSPKIEETDKALFHEAVPDYLGINFYGPAYIKASEDHYPLNFEEFKGERSRDWANNAKVEPKALADILVRIHTEYGAPKVWITENGCSFGDEELNDLRDEWRIDYLKNHLAAVKQAMESGVKVQRYYVWSLMDNLEWVQGYDERYGIIYIDRKQNLKRTIKKSGHWYAQVIANHGFNL
jgi:beta-glucosidase